jgi:hypothetical protein
MHNLLSMLTYARPHATSTEREFAARFLAPLPGAYVDAAGNYHCKVGDSHTLWSCHYDTAHWEHGRQTIHTDKRTVQLSKRARRHHGACLGGDDSVGVWLMTKMIHARVPGWYVFHAGEESGCIGSRALRDTHADWLASFNHAVAFDRAGTSDIITHQMSERTCSAPFADALANALSHSGLAYKPCSTGVYTDTYEYIDLIGECSNVSTGVAHCHSARETVDLDHAARLADLVCALQPDAWPVVRVPGEYEPLHQWGRLADWREVKYARDWACDNQDSQDRPFWYSAAQPSLKTVDGDDEERDRMYLYSEYAEVSKALRSIH